MMRLPRFDYHAPSTIAEAAEILAGEGPAAMLIAGGTDLLPNMKRRQQTPGTLVALRGIDELRQHDVETAGATLGAGLTLTDVVRNDDLRERYAGLWQAAVQVATPHLRNMGTLGGNLCLDTRCNYYDQNYEWRKAISFCMKKDGETCWVAPASKRCLAVSSTDTAPALASLDARVRLVSKEGSRELALLDLYKDDGIQYLSRRPDEILVSVSLPESSGWASTYWKLRRRGSFDFPVLSVAAAVKQAGDGTIEDARIVLGAVASAPRISEDGAACLIGNALTDESIDAAASRVATQSKPMDNTDFVLHWRKRVTAEFVRYALRELRGDPMGETRRRIAQHELIPL
ncbi:MAG: FAD binding domain-containing protein [Acidobacteriota bacterium]|nr:FAD binding domain-containing protein [Acidobacteriota bacterium]